MMTDKKLSENLNIRTTPAMKKALEHAARQQNRSMNNYLNNLIQQDLRRQGIVSDTITDTPTPITDTPTPITDTPTPAPSGTNTRTSYVKDSDRGKLNRRKGNHRT